MTGMTGFAIFCGLVIALPYSINQALLGLAWIAATGWLVTGIVFAKGDARAFCIGAATVASSMWTSLGGRFAQGIGGFVRTIGVQFGEYGGGVYGGYAGDSGFELWFVHICLVAAAIANGYFCIRARRYFERHK